MACWQRALRDRSDAPHGGIHQHRQWGRADAPAAAVSGGADCEGAATFGAGARRPGLGLLISTLGNSLMRTGSLDNAQPYQGMTTGNYAEAAPNPYGGYTTGSSYSASPYTPAGSGWHAPSFSTGSGGSLNAWRPNPNDPGHGTYRPRGPRTSVLSGPCRDRPPDPSVSPAQRRHAVRDRRGSRRQVPATQSASADPDTLDDYEEGTLADARVSSPRAHLPFSLHCADRHLYRRSAGDSHCNSILLTPTIITEVDVHVYVLPSAQPAIAGPPPMSTIHAIWSDRAQRHSTQIHSGGGHRRVHPASWG